MKYVLVGLFGIVIILGIFAFRPTIAEDIWDFPKVSAINPAGANDVSMLFVGDCMLGRHVEILMNNNGSDYPFEKINSLLKESDLVIANLEGPIVEKHALTPSNGFAFNFSKTAGSLLERHNIQIVSLANNHTVDFGQSGYDFTVQTLNENDVDSFGHPFAFSDKYILRRTVNGNTFIFVGFNITNPKFNFVSAKEFIKNIKKENGEVLIVSVHGGEEYKLSSNKTQQNFL